MQLNDIRTAGCLRWAGRGGVRSGICKLIACGLLAVAVGFGELWTAHGTWLLHSAEFANEPPPLDSFSVPSVALGVLNRESQRLVSVYSQSRDELSDNLASARLTEQRADAVSRLVQFDTRIKAFELELTCRLLWVHADCHRDKEFIDDYLHLIQGAPNSGDVLLWLPQAIKSAQASARTRELLDGLGHLMEFSANHQRSEVIRDMLAQRGLMVAK